MLGLLAGALALLSQVAYGPAHTLDALDRYGSPWSRCVVGYETGWTWDPNAVGDHGTSFGAAQLHSPGLLDDFYARGWDNPFNPYQAVVYMEEARSRGLSSHWTPVKRGLCPP